MRYTVRPTTAGNQDALAFPKDFSREYPNLFRGRYDVHPLSADTFLLTPQVEAEPKADEDDPVFGIFLGFLEQQMQARPDLITPLAPADIAGLDDLLRGVPSGDEVNWEEASRLS
ncbi:hypothetical protein [Longimicrobium sp.]|jgi:hypothetical protein|uniref:hypothetical protein n=1 Tax=Longimicrobium sp. TaxID=2029185 RepID=UPI002ED77948